MWKYNHVTKTFYHFYLSISARRQTTSTHYTSTEFGVDTRRCFCFEAWRDGQTDPTHKVTDTTDHYTHASATASVANKGKDVSPTFV